MKSIIKKLIPAIIIFLVGIIATIVGALFKIQHWPFGSEILTIGNLIEVLGILIAIFVLFKFYRSK